MTKLLTMLPAPMRRLVVMHRGLLARSWAFDAVYAVVSLLYLLLPLNVEAVSLQNLLFGLFALFLCTQYHMHAIRSTCGGPGFYLMMPMGRARMLALAYAAAMAPYAALLLAATGVIAMAAPGTAGDTVARAGHAAVFYLLAKTLPLPTLVMWRKGPVWVLLFHLGFFPVGFATMIVSEMVLARLPLAPLTGVLAFLLGMAWLQWMVLRSARLPAQ
jgi:hypothetical protein